jgi:hypothetical protein
MLPASAHLAETAQEKQGIDQLAKAYVLWEYVYLPNAVMNLGFAYALAGNLLRLLKTI